MSEAKLGPTRGFRPWPKVRERLEYAEKLGLNGSQLINRVLDDHLRDYMRKEVDAKRTEIRKLLDAPMP